MKKVSRSIIFQDNIEPVDKILHDLNGDILCKKCRQYRKAKDVEDFIKLLDSRFYQHCFSSYDIYCEFCPGCYLKIRDRYTMANEYIRQWETYITNINKERENVKS